MSIIDTLKAQGKDSSFTARKKLAKDLLGIDNYSGSAQENIQLESLLKTNTQKSADTQEQKTTSDTSFTTGQDDMLGAGGRGESGATEEDVTSASDFGVPFSELGNYVGDNDYVIPQDPKLTSQEASKLGREYLLGKNEFAGLTRSQAEEKAKQKQAEINKQVTDKTSFSFNKEATSGAKKILDNFSFKLNENNSDVFLSNGTKEEKNKMFTELATREIASLFNNEEDFNNQLLNDLEFKKQIDNFTKSGGDIATIISNIKPQETIQDSGMQDVSTYLANLSPNATKAQQDAYNSLIPEKELAQKQIIMLGNIPEKHKELYLGSSEQLGILNEKRILAEEKKKILENKIEREKEDVRARTALLIEQNNADLELQNAEIEENRIKAKNYMTGMLAKMGALNTTSQAITSLATLDEKYQRQSILLKSRVQMKNKEIQLQLSEQVNDLETRKENAIYDLQADLTKSKEEVLKEIAKLEQSSMKDIFNIMGKYTTQLRIQNDKYSLQAKKDAEKYAKEMQKQMSSISPIKKVSSTVTTTKGKNSFKEEASKRLESTRGKGTGDDYVDPDEYTNIFNEWINKGGTIKDFTATFPPNKYINPANNTIAEQFRTTPKTKKQEVADDEI